MPSLRPPFLRALRPAFRTSLHLRHASTRAAEIYDVVIVGGGPAGLSLASSLRSSSVTKNLRVALVEGMDLSPAKRWDPAPDVFSNRVSSLTPGSVQFMKDIGAWGHIRRERVQAYRAMKVWDGVSGSQISFSSPHDGLDTSTIAYMCENNNLVSSLLSRITSLGEGIDIMDKTRVETISHGDNDGDLDLSSWPVVTVSSGKQLAARLLVGADGANSPVRTFAGIETRGWDYGRHGVVATIKLTEDQAEKTAFQRFLPTGPVAMLPLPGPYASLVWSTTPQHAATLKSLPTADFAALVNAAFRLSHVDIEFLVSHAKAGVAEEVAWRESVTPFDPAQVPAKAEVALEKSVASFPLKFRHADTYISDRVALIGDAAHSIHPLAGQGLNQGIGDVRSLISSLETAVQNGQDIGSVLSLEPYVADRYAANHVLLGVVDKLHKLYGTDFAPVVAVRSLGLKMVDAFEGVKGVIMKQAAGR